MYTRPCPSVLTVSACLSVRLGTEGTDNQAGRGHSRALSTVHSEDTDNQSDIGHTLEHTGAVNCIQKEQITRYFGNDIYVNALHTQIYCIHKSTAYPLHTLMGYQVMVLTAWFPSGVALQSHHECRLSQVGIHLDPHQREMMRWTEATIRWLCDSVCGEVATYGLPVSQKDLIST